MKSKDLAIIIIVAIVVGAAAFYGGMQYQKSNNRAAFGAFGQGRGTMMQGFGQNGQNGQNFRPVRGSIISQDDKSITVKMQDGSTRIVLLSDKTVYLKSTAGAKGDLKTGDTVNVIGSQNSDGSVTAQDVQINPPTARNFVNAGK